MFNGEYSLTDNLLDWVHSMMNYCVQHKCRPKNMIRLAQTYLGPVQAYWTHYVQFDHKVRVELQFDGLRCEPARMNDEARIWSPLTLFLGPVEQTSGHVSLQSMEERLGLILSTVPKLGCGFSTNLKIRAS